MATLVVNLPSIDVWVRKEYLRDGEDGHGEFVKGIWVTAKSIPGRAFYFETYLPDYGALYDNYLLVLLLLNHKPRLQIWIFIISSFGIAWTMAWGQSVNNL